MVDKDPKLCTLLTVGRNIGWIHKQDKTQLRLLSILRETASKIHRSSRCKIPAMSAAGPYPITDWQKAPQ